MKIIIKTSLDLFPQSDSILLFFMNQKDNNLTLVRSVKKDHPIISEKNGDSPDKWVMRHNKTLVIEDLTKEFRFDYNKIIAFNETLIHVYISEVN